MSKGKVMPKYLPKILRATRLDPPQPGSVTHVTVYHDDGCAIFRGGACDCNPDVRVSSWAAKERTL